ncbi:hypothetical protein TrCOL_g1185 [Triparma columacea]|uniref:Uncharacterized protein n=1 Tax=Triparma columacea TaxID=722753 RepID=A0A9W7L4X3_9STRA|nr:hypothetical protein TrCOL_g1185 [Triparma columacea]
MLKSLNDIATYLIQPDGNIVPGLFRKSNRPYLSALKIIKGLRIGESVLEAEVGRLCDVVENVRIDRDRLTDDCKRLVGMYKDGEKRVAELEKRVKRGNRRRRIAERGAERLVGVVEEGKIVKRELEKGIEEVREEMERRGEEWECRRKEWESSKVELLKMVKTMSAEKQNDKANIDELTKYAGTLEKRLSGGFGRGSGEGELEGHLEGKINGLEGIVKELEERKEGLKEGVRELEKRKGELVEGVVELEGKKIDMGRIMEDMEETMKGIKGGIEELQGRREELAREIEGLEGRREELIEAVREMEEGGGRGQEEGGDVEGDDNIPPPPPPPPLPPTPEQINVGREEEEEVGSFPTTVAGDVDEDSDSDFNEDSDITPVAPIKIISEDPPSETTSWESEEVVVPGVEEDDGGWRGDVKTWVRQIRKKASKATGKRGFFSKKT